MNEMFSQGGKGSTGILTNKQAIARKFGVKQNEVVYFSVGVDLGGYKVIYDKATQRAYSLPVLPVGTTAVSLSAQAVLVHSEGTVDLGELAVEREEFVTVTGSFITGATINTKNEILTHGGGKYRWDGELPKIVYPGSTPNSTGEIKLGAWVSVGVTYGVYVSVDMFITSSMESATDHTAAIQEALNSGATHVTFPARTLYWDGTPLIVKPGTTINAYGCTLKLKPGHYPSISTGITNRKAYTYDAGNPEHYDIIVNGLVIDGNKSNVTWDTTVDTSTFNGFWFHQATRIKLTDCSVINAYGSRGGQPGIMFKFCTDVQVTRCRTYDTDRNGMAFYSTANFKVIGGSYQVSRWREPILMTSEDNSDGSPVFQISSGVVLGAYCNNIGSKKGKWGMRLSGSYDVYIGQGTRIYHQNTVEDEDNPSVRHNTMGVIISMYPSNSPLTRKATLDGVYINGANADVNIENSGVIDAKILNVTSENVQNALSINTTNGGDTFGVVKVENYTCTLTGVKTAPRIKNISEFVGRNIDIRNPATAFTIDNYGKFTIDNLRIDTLTASSNAMNVINPKTTASDWVSSISNYHGVNNVNNAINLDGKAYIATNMGLATTTGTGIPCMEFGSKFYLFKNSSNQLVRKFGSPPTSLTDGTVIG
ncbi:hypothetical protein P3446_13410 [Escherichia coli]|uniref:tail fiber/spike domain-containing protein n=1 Tax=Escherichia coli TaxID=562 RepID=UPI0023ED6EAA|nr:hypothetical protein [Escherichia coli]MDF4164749.1 hypothetical protein [Escherichia coli]